MFRDFTYIDDIVDGIIHNDENINSFVLIDDAALIDDTTKVECTTSEFIVAEFPDSVSNIIFVVLIDETLSKELTVNVLNVAILPANV